MNVDYIKFKVKDDMPAMQVYIDFIMIKLHSELVEKVADQYFNGKVTTTELDNFSVRQINERRFVYYLEICLGEINFLANEYFSRWEMGYKFTPFI